MKADGMAGGAIFHLDVSTISRSQGRSAVTAAAYRAGAKMLDARTGSLHDYTRKRGVTETFIATPDNCDWITDRSALWDAAEAAETRKNSVVAREWLVALPDALSAAQRAELTRTLAAELVTRYGVAVDVAIHAPNREGDQRNHHAHLLTTTRQARPDGMGPKTRILDTAKTGGDEIAAMREWWAGTVNDALTAANSTARVDHRRKSTIAAQAQAEAAKLDQMATDLDALNSTPASLKELWKGFGSAARAIRSGGLSSLTAEPEKATSLRNRATTLREQAKAIDTPPNKHNGPKLTAYKRRMAPIWEHEAKEKAAKEAALRAAERQKAAEREERARKAKEAREAALKAADEAKRRAKLAERYAAITLPLIQRARKDPHFAPQIERWGIDLNRPDHDVARDYIWQKAGQGYDGREIWAIVTDDAKRADERQKAEAEAQHKANVQAFTAKQVERAGSFPTPSKRWPFPRFMALEPNSIQTAFSNKYRERLTPNETTDTIRAMTARWISRIVEDLHALKPMRSIWTALTGGNAEAGDALRNALETNPDLADPLNPTIDEHEARYAPPKPKPPTPGFGGPSM